MPFSSEDSFNHHVLDEVLGVIEHLQPLVATALQDFTQRPESFATVVRWLGSVGLSDSLDRKTASQVSFSEWMQVAHEMGFLAVISHLEAVLVHEGLRRAGRLDGDPPSLTDDRWVEEAQELRTRLREQGVMADSWFTTHPFPLPASLGGGDDLQRFVTTFIHDVDTARGQGFVLRDLIGSLYNRMSRAGHRRQKGQVFTPYPAAQLMAKMAIRATDEVIYDPSCGSGTLLVAAVHEVMHQYPDHANDASITERLLGTDIDPLAIQLARVNLLCVSFSLGHVTSHVVCRDGLLLAPHETLPAEPHPCAFRSKDEEEHQWVWPRPDVVLMNPPYRGFAALDPTDKDRWISAITDNLVRAFPGRIQSEGASVIIEGMPWDGKADLYAYFMANTVATLRPGGRGVVLVSPTWMMSQSGRVIRHLLSSFTRIHAMIMHLTEPLFENTPQPSVFLVFDIVRPEEISEVVSSHAVNFITLTAPYATLWEDHMDEILSWVNSESGPHHATWGWHERIPQRILRPRREWWDEGEE